MYAYPTWKPPRTTDGLKWVILSFYLYLVVLVLDLAFAALADMIMGSITAGASAQDVLAALALVLIAALAVAALGIIVLVFYLLGFGYLYSGRNEFGPAHAKDMDMALWMLIGAMIVTLVGVAVQIAIAFSEFVGPVPAPPNAGSIIASIALSVAFGVLSAALVAAMLIFCVRGLADPAHRTHLLVAGGLGAATPGVVAALSFALLGASLATGTAAVDATLGIPAAAGSGLGIITFVLFLMVYRRARQRIEIGELKPSLPPPMPYPMWAPPPPPPVAPPQAPPVAPPVQPLSPAEPQTPP